MPCEGVLAQASVDIPQLGRAVSAGSDHVGLGKKHHRQHLVVLDVGIDQSAETQRDAAVQKGQPVRAHAQVAREQAFQVQDGTAGQDVEPADQRPAGQDHRETHRGRTHARFRPLRDKARLVRARAAMFLLLL